MSVYELAIVFITLACGGILKGATGAGAPILAVPAMAALYDVRFAIVIMTVPNIVTNFTQLWQNRQHALKPSFLIPFLLAASMGVVAGSWILVGLDARSMSLIVALAVLLYLVLRLTNSKWHLNTALATKLAAPFGFLSGILQGSAGISAPVSVSFINAMRLERRVFMTTVSMLFVTFGAIQLTTLSLMGVVTPMGFLLSCAAVLPMFLGMPLGAFIGSNVSRTTFDRLIMLLLAALAARMLWEALAPKL